MAEYNPLPSEKCAYLVHAIREARIVRDKHKDEDELVTVIDSLIYNAEGVLEELLWRLRTRP